MAVDLLKCFERFGDEQTEAGLVLGNRGGRQVREFNTPRDPRIDGRLVSAASCASLCGVTAGR
jgi:hypothetical protein